jgi:hypothetical protein
MQTKTETPTKTFFIPAHIYRALERRAKAEGRTPDRCAETLLLGAMINDHVPADCPYCKETIMVPTDGPLITTEAFKQLVKEGLLELKQERKRARVKELTPKRVDVPMDADLLAEAKKYDVNIEEATREHFKELRKQYPEKKA